MGNENFDNEEFGCTGINFCTETENEALEELKRKIKEVEELLKD